MGVSQQWFQIFFFARVSSLIGRLTSPRTQDGTLGGLHTAAERIQPAEQDRGRGRGVFQVKTMFQPQRVINYRTEAGGGGYFK